MCVYDCHKEALPVSLYGSVSYYLQIVDYSGFTTTIKQFVLHSKEDTQPAAAPWRFDFHNALERRNLLRLYWLWILTGGKRCKVFPQGVTKGYTVSLSKKQKEVHPLHGGHLRNIPISLMLLRKNSNRYIPQNDDFFCFKLKIPTYCTFNQCLWCL